MTENCPICRTLQELAEHHIHPIQYGGPQDGPLFELCANCHNNVHRQAERFTSVASGIEGSKARLVMPPEHFERAKTLIAAIVRAKIIFMEKERREGKSGKARRRMLQIPMSDLDWLKLHKVKKDLGFTSMEDFIVSILKSVISMN